jgi:poly(A) polymerase
MTEMAPSLAGADWLRAPAVGKIFAILDEGGEAARIIGGAVRNALAGLPVGEIDFATPLTPDMVTRRAEAAGIKAVPTGIEYGTVTLVVRGTPYQVTTLREDVATDGRHAVVRFGHDWTADARRRDFTVNALSVDVAGTMYDPLGGYRDIRARRIRFIGDPAERIEEDRLRILRFFRFNAEFGAGPFDPAGLSASIRARQELRQLSAERVGQEMRRLVLSPRAAEAVGVMQDCGILGIVFGGIAYLGAFGRLVAFAPEAGVALRFAALGCRIEEDVERLARLMRLSNAERDAMRAAVIGARRLPTPVAAPDARRLLYRLGVEAWRDAVALAFAWSTSPPDDPAWRDLRRLPEHWQPPRFPLSGGDALGVGAVRGPAIGRLLKALEAWWIERDFAPDETALRARLQQMVAAAQ